MRFRGHAAAVLGFCFAARLAAEGQAPQEQPEFSVLTPAVEKKIMVAAGFSATDMLGLGFAKGLATQDNTLQLRRLADEERFDPAQRLVDRLVEALAKAGHTAVYEPISRRPAGSIQSLSRSDLPEKPEGRQFLDVTIRWICLCRGDKYVEFSPSMSLGWRVLDSRGGIIEPTRELTYVHDDGPTVPLWTFKRNDKQEAAAAGSRYPAAAVSASCNYTDVDDGLRNPTVLWGCFGEAMDVAVERLVQDLQSARAGE
jgi:hypothetical protein